MKIETGTVTIVRISDIMQSHRLDPIRVTLDDIEPGKGRINIECYGEAWACYWGAMGDRTIAQFFCSLDNGYIISNFCSGWKPLYATKFGADALVALCKKTIRQRRKGICEYRFCDQLSRSQAHALMERLGEIEHCDTRHDCWAHAELFDLIFGEDGTLLAMQAEEPNPDYDHLERICNAVREALVKLEVPA